MAKYSFGNKSLNMLTGVHPSLAKCCFRALEYGLMDFSVIQGVRTLDQQKALYAQGRTAPGSIVTWTMESKHLIQPDHYGHAVDLAPFPLDWNDTAAFNYLATLMVRAANELGVNITWGGWWKTSKDLPHFEIMVD